MGFSYCVPPLTKWLDLTDALPQHAQIEHANNKNTNTHTHIESHRAHWLGLKTQVFEWHFLYISHANCLTTFCLFKFLHIWLLVMQYKRNGPQWMKKRERERAVWIETYDWIWFVWFHAKGITRMKHNKYTTHVLILLVTPHGNAFRTKNGKKSKDKASSSFDFCWFMILEWTKKKSKFICVVWSAFEMCEIVKKNTNRKKETWCYQYNIINIVLNSGIEKTHD